MSARTSNVAAPKPKAGPDETIIVTFKVKQSLVNEVDAVLDRYLWTRWAGTMSRSEFIVRAVREKLDQIERSRTRRRRRAPLVS